MSALDPLISSPANRACPYAVFGALLSGGAEAALAVAAAAKPAPSRPAAASSSAVGGTTVQLTISRSSKPDELVNLQIARTSGASATPGPPKKVETVEKAPKEPKPAAAAKVPAASPAKTPSAAGITAAKVPLSEPPKLDAADIAACQIAQDVTPMQAKVQAEAKKAGLESAHFWRVRSDYYEQELTWRRDMVGAASVQQLCKSMIMENTKVGELSLEQATAAGRIKYVCVVLQYAGAKLQKEKLTDAIRRMEGANAVGKKQYSLRMVSQETSDELSGFEHNAVTVVGMATPVPVLLSNPIKNLPEGKVWLGGGEVDLKLRVDVAELVTKFMPAGRPIEFADVLES